MQLNELCKLAFERSTASGFGVADMEKNVALTLMAHMLVVTEMAEATEEERNQKPAFYLVDKEHPGHPTLGLDNRLGIPVDAARIKELCETLPGAKPEGQAVELADALIRICDWAARNGWDMEAVVEAKMAYNATRGHRHGGKAA